MRNIKFISVFAAVGFILSFVFGLFSHSSFISILLKALIFSVCFVVLGIVINLVFNKFLIDPNADDLGVAGFSDLTSKPAGENPKVGQTIDIVVEDEELPESDSSNHFVVGDNHQMLKATDIKEESFLNNEEDKVGKEFIPLRKVENEKNFSGTEPVSPDEVQSLSSSAISDNTEEEIDTLPDMEKMVFSEDNTAEESNNESFVDSVIDSPASSYKKSDGSTPDVKDASLIAKAISTALAEEDS